MASARSLTPTQRSGHSNSSRQCGAIRAPAREGVAKSLQPRVWKALGQRLLNANPIFIAAPKQCSQQDAGESRVV
jgi:hypothetical protein